MMWRLFDDPENIRLCLIREDGEHAYYELSAPWAAKKLVERARAIDPQAKITTNLDVGADGAPPTVSC